MVDELIAIEKLERIRRLIKQGYDQLALNMIEAEIKERKARVAQFEEEFDNIPI